jgi:hypothetical protein
VNHNSVSPSWRRLKASEGVVRLARFEGALRAACPVVAHQWVGGIQYHPGDVSAAVLAAAPVPQFSAEYRLPYSIFQKFYNSGCSEYQSCA